MLCPPDREPLVQAISSVSIYIYIHTCSPKGGGLSWGGCIHVYTRGNAAKDDSVCPRVCICEREMHMCIDV